MNAPLTVALMHPDLLEAQASVDWALSQLPGLAKRLDDWMDRSIVMELRDPGAVAEHNLIIGVQKELLPLSFNVEVGAYINALRSGLDILAAALVRRHRLPFDEDEVYFPIARSEATFTKQSWPGRKFIDALPANEQQIIASLRPYKGGSAPLWALHHLDIVRKHRRLLTVLPRPITITLQGTLQLGDFKPLAVDAVHVNEEIIIGMLRKGVDPKLVRAKFYVALDEQEHIQRRPVPGMLAYLYDVVTGIIRQFDY
jgi:hypothetical protein